jgi:hypothetical protein
VHVSVCVRECVCVYWLLLSVLCFYCFFFINQALQAPACRNYSFFALKRALTQSEVGNGL